MILQDFDGEITFRPAKVGVHRLTCTRYFGTSELELLPDGSVRGDEPYVICWILA